MRSKRFTEFDRIRRRLIKALMALGAVTLIGVFGYAWFGRAEHGLVDAIYMTVITLSTVGFGEVIDTSHDMPARIFTTLLVLMGMGVVAYSVPLVTAFVIEGQFSNIFARRRMEKAIARMSGHFVVCGDSTTAWHVAGELLRSDREVALVTPSDEALEEAQEQLGSVPGVVGDATENATLEDAGVARAAGIVACMSHEKDNVLVVLTARRLAPSARVIASTEHAATEEKLRAVGADAVVSPSRIGGLRMASELVRPRVVSFLDTMLRAERALRVEEVHVEEGSGAVGQPLSTLGLREAEGVLLLAIKRTGVRTFEFKPPQSLLLEAGMTLVVVVEPEARHRLEEKLKK